MAFTELRIIRNTAFAIHGHTFRSVDLQEHFARLDWYESKETDATKYLSEIEMANVRLIQEVEASFENYDPDEVFRAITRGDLDRLRKFASTA